MAAFMEAAIPELQKPFLTDAQIAATRAIMGSTLSSLTTEPISSSSKMANWPSA